MPEFDACESYVSDVEEFLAVLACASAQETSAKRINTTASLSQVVVCEEIVKIPVQEVF